MTVVLIINLVGETTPAHLKTRPGYAVPLSNDQRRSLEQRRARHEGIERRPELRAVAVLFLQDFVLRAGDHQMRAGAQMIGEFLDRGSGNNGVVGGRQDQDRLGGLW